MEYKRPRGTALDDHIGLVARRLRRFILRYLIREPTNRATVDELVEYIIVEEESSETGRDRETIRIELYHNHLPRLDDTGIIDYDPRSGEIRYSPNGQLETLLECFPGG